MAESLQNCAVADVAQGACFVIASSDTCCMTRVIRPCNAVADAFRSSSIANPIAEPKFPMRAHLGRAHAMRS